jgi:hypothetical protein
MEPTLDTRCNWCDKPILFHSTVSTLLCGALCRFGKMPTTYELKPAWVRPENPGMSIAASSLTAHVNRVKFEGCLTLIGVVSNRSPSGARGHQVILTYAAAQEALPSLMGMCLCYKPNWDGHDVRQKVGIITDAHIEGKRLLVSGYIFCRDFPIEAAALKDPFKMGMSYEMAEAHVTDMRQTVWELNQVTFTGAAILLREKAAYRETSFKLIENVEVAS